MNNDLINIICGLLGFAFVTFSRMQSLKTDFEKANQVFVVKKYFEKELFGMIASLISIAIWYFSFGEVSEKYPSIQGFTICSFVAFGAMGSWVIQRALGKTKGFIRTVVDDKTNELDKIKNT